jgi:hypothetical protein
MTPRHPQLPGLERIDHYAACVGTRYYPTPRDFLLEALRHGVSKRLPTIPRHLVPGKSRLFLIHDQCSVTPANAPPSLYRGLFACCTVTAIHVIIPDDVPPDEFQRKLALSGIQVRPVPLSRAMLEPPRGCGRRTAIGSIYAVSAGNLAHLNTLPAERSLSGPITAIRPPLRYWGKRFRGLKHWRDASCLLDPSKLPLLASTCGT